MWIHVGNQITPEWPFGQFGCKINVFIQGLYRGNQSFSLNALCLNDLIQPLVLIDCLIVVVAVGVLFFVLCVWGGVVVVVVVVVVVFILFS